MLRFKILVFSLFLSLVASAVLSVADDTSSGEAPLPASQPVKVNASAQVAAERAQVAKDLAAARAALDAATTEGQAAPERLQREIQLLSEIDLQLGQLLAALEQSSELKTQSEQQQTDLDNLRARGPVESPPYSFALLETLGDELVTEAAREESRTDVVELAQSALKSATGKAEEKERARRKAKEALETNTDDATRPALSWALRVAELESQIAQYERRLREIELANQKIDREIHETRLTFLKEKLAQVRLKTQFQREGLNEFLARLDDAEYQLNRQLDYAKSDLSLRDSQWTEARRRLDNASDKSAALIEEVEARRLARQARQREVTLLGQQLQSIADARQVWNRRYEIFNQSVEKSKIATWETESQEAIEKLARDIRLHRMRLEELRREAVTLDGKVAAVVEDDPATRRWLNEQRIQIDNLIKIFTSTVERLEATRRLHAKLLAQIGERRKSVEWGERFEDAWVIVLDVWNYELTSINDNPITVRKVIIGLVLFFVGTLLARRLTRLLARRFFPRLGLNEGAAAAVQSMLFYLLVLTVAMLSLRIVNVPLTAFTILGGALAIGIGFGSQNVMNNFISGLIMLVERPIRVGDLIQIEDMVGTVEYIGPRSTRVRAPQNMDIIVPNSSFLEKNVINWTLSDDRYRAQVIVGVAYGSPTRDVTKLIEKAMSEHGKVLSKPKPIILFSDFGDNALVFEAHFWVIMRRLMDRRIIESDIRFRIDSLFREAGIVIAFPQRDLHFDSKSPIRVRVETDATLPTDTDNSEN